MSGSSDQHSSLKSGGRAELDGPASVVQNIRVSRGISDNEHGLEECGRRAGNCVFAIDKDSVVERAGEHGVVHVFLQIGIKSGSLTKGNVMHDSRVVRHPNDASSRFRVQIVERKTDGRRRRGERDNLSVFQQVEMGQIDGIEPATNHAERERHGRRKVSVLLPRRVGRQALLKH